MKNPTDTQFIGYVGSADIHDAVLMKVQHNGTKASVTLKTQSGQILEIEFEGVVSVKSDTPEGMILYSLSEMRHPQHRLFIFTNWEDEAEAHLEIVADDFRLKTHI